MYTIPTALRSLGVWLALALTLNLNAAQISGSVEVQNAHPRLLKGIPVTLFDAGDGSPVVLGTAETDENGDFTIDSAVDETDGVFYLSADIRRRVRFVTVLGNELPATATVNELTTVAACYSMAQFLRTGEIMGDEFRLYIASQMHGNIVDSETGEIGEVLATAPNAMQTTSLMTVNSLANVMNRCALNPYVALAFLRNTRLEGESAPADNIVGLANLARDPGYRAKQIYRLARHRPQFEPALEEEPDAWCVTIKVNSSGDNSPEGLIAGPANVAFDSYGFAWIPNNVYQGGTTSANFLICLQPNGKPADGSNGSPVSPIIGGGIYGGGWGVSVNDDDLVWVANFGWGGEEYWPDEEDGVGANGSISLVDATDGTPLSVPNGFFGGVWRAQAVQVDSGNNLWIASFENDSVVFWPNSDPLEHVALKQYAGARPFGVYPIDDKSAWVANSGGLKGTFQASVGLVKINAEGQPEHKFLIPVGNTLRVIQTDSYGNAWVASNGDNTIYAISPTGEILGGYNGGGVYGPWGLCVDGEDNIWVANFGFIEQNTDFTPGRISKLAGANPDSYPRRRMEMGDPISPDAGYTVKTGGDPVTLADGQPLYGDLGVPSYTPMMRQTSLQIDAAGNIWSINNWKPDANIDFSTNPGGDGVVIYVGIAPPPVN